MQNMVVAYKPRRVQVDMPNVIPKNVERYIPLRAQIPKTFRNDCMKFS